MTSASWVSCGQRVVWDMGRTLREPPYGLAEPFPIRVPAGSKHQNVLERSGLITRGRTAQLRDSPLKETATPATEGGGSAVAFTRERSHTLAAKPRLLPFLGGTPPRHKSVNWGCRIDREPGEPELRSCSS